MTKLCKLISEWPAGTIGMQVRLNKLQIYKQLSNKYAASGWLQKIGVGAYVRAGEKATWQGGIYAMQQDLGLRLHIGGLSSLELLGRAHFVPLGMNQHARLFIFAHGRHLPRYLPKWFLQLENVTSIYVTAPLFSSDLGLKDFNCGNFKILISAPDRAIFELLSLVRHKSSFEHACLIMQHQSGLRSDVVEQLLQECSSQVTKRLFLYLARKFNLDFLPYVNLKGIDLGRGIRHIAQGEVFDSELKIYVPQMSDKINPDLEVPDV